MYKAYLTIDDAPSVDMAAKVDLLVRKNIPCVCFCQGNFLEERPRDALHALKAGHIIGNHSYSHPKFSDIPLAEAVVEIQKTDAILQKLYEQAGVPWVRKFFRFPHGDRGDFLYGDRTKEPTAEGKERKDALQALLEVHGYSQPQFGIPSYKNEGCDWHWSFDVMEYGMRYQGKYEVETLEEVLQRFDAHLIHLDSDEIFLIHDHSETSMHFQMLIERFEAADVCFANVMDRYM